MHYPNLRAEVFSVMALAFIMTTTLTTSCRKESSVRRVGCIWVEKNVQYWIMQVYRGSSIGFSGFRISLIWSSGLRDCTKFWVGITGLKNAIGDPLYNRDKLYEQINNNNKQPTYFPSLVPWVNSFTCFILVAWIIIAWGFYRKNFLKPLLFRYFSKPFWNFGHSVVCISKWQNALENE